MRSRSDYRITDSRDFEVLLDPYIDLINHERDILKHMPNSLYNSWKDWLRYSRSDDRGYRALTEEDVGIFPTIMGWYDSIKEMTLKGIYAEENTKPEVGIINDIDNTIIVELKKKIKRDVPIFYPDDWAETTNMLSRLVLYLNYRHSRNELQYDLIIRKKELKDVITNDVVPCLDLSLRTWDTSTPYTPTTVSRLAYLVIDANQPKDGQIIPNLKEPRKQYRRYLARRLRKMLSKVPEEGLRSVIIEGNGVDMIRTHQVDRKERTLCLAKLIKMRTKKETIGDYNEAVKRLYPEVFEKETTYIA